MTSIETGVSSNCRTSLRRDERVWQALAASSRSLGRNLALLPCDRAIPSPHDEGVGRGQGRGAFERRLPNHLAPPLPGPLLRSAEEREVGSSAKRPVCSVRIVRANSLWFIPSSKVSL